MNATRCLAAVWRVLILAALVACGGGGDSGGVGAGGNPGGGGAGGGGGGGGQVGPDPAPDPTGNPTSNDLIDAALTAGQLTAEQALVYKMYAEFGDPRLPSEYVGDDTGFIEGDAQHQVVAHIARVGVGNVSAATLDALMPFFVPPYYEGSWWHQRNPGATTLAASRDRASAAGPRAHAAAGNPNCRPFETYCSLLADWKKVEGTKVVVWYLEANEAADRPKAVLLAGEYDNKIWPELTGTMGRTPPSDVGTGLLQAETDGRLDVILVDMPANKEGSTFPSGYACKAVSTHIYLNRNLSNQGLVAQAAHEFMHSIQWSIDVVAPCLEAYYTTQEATAVWATHRVYPTNNWEQKYAKHYLKGGWVSEPYDHRPARDSLFRYGAYVLPLFLQTRFGDSIVKAIWDKTTQYSQELFAIDSALGAAGSSLEQEWPKFIAANWNQETIRTYRDADPPLLDHVDLNGDDTLTMDSSGTVYLGHDLELKHAAAAYFRVVFGDSAARSITIVNGLRFRADAQNQTGFGDNLVLTGLDTLDRRGASLQVFLKINGTWQSGPSNLTNVPWLSICRDDPAGKIDEMIFMYGNSEFLTGAPNYQQLVPRTKNPGVLATSVGCRDWTGSLTMTAPLSHGTEKLTINGIKLTNALPTAAPPPGPGPAAYPLAAGQDVSPGFGWVYRIADGSATWTYSDDGDGCTRQGRQTFDIKGPNPIITTSGFVPPASALSRAIVIPGFLNNVLQSVANLSYDWRCVDSDGTVTTGNQVTGTRLDIAVAPNDPAVRITPGGLMVGGTGAQAGDESSSGNWLLQAATN